MVFAAGNGEALKEFVDFTEEIGIRSKQYQAQLVLLQHHVLHLPLPALLINQPTVGHSLCLETPRSVHRLRPVLLGLPAIFGL